MFGENLGSNGGGPLPGMISCGGQMVVNSVMKVEGRQWAAKTIFGRP